MNKLHVLEINSNKILHNYELMEVLNWLFSITYDVAHIIIFPHFCPVPLICSQQLGP